MDDTTTNNSSDATTQDSGSTAAAQPASEPTYAAHETDVTPDEGRTRTNIPTDPNAQPDPYGDMLRYKERGYTKEPLTNEEFFEKRRREREGVNTAPETQRQSFDLNGSFNAFLSKPDAGALPMLEGMYNSNQETYTRFVDDVVLSQPEYILGLLASRGFIPEHLAPFPKSYVDPLTLDWMPEEFREYASTLDPDSFAELELMPDEVRDRFLQQGLDNQRFKQAEEERQFQQHQQALDSATQEWAQNVNSFTQQYDKGHYDHLAKEFQPFEDAAANKQAGEYVMLATMAQAEGDRQLMQGAQAVMSHLADAADARFDRNEKAAKQHEAKARRLAGELDKQYRELLDKNIKQFQAFFEHAPGARQPAQEQPQQYIH